LLVRQARGALPNKNALNRGTMTEIADIRVKVDYERLPCTSLGVDQEVDATPV